MLMPRSAPKQFPSFSVVINTLNRAESLRRTLESFRWIGYPGQFEVIVINGPSTDATSQVLREFAGRIRVGSCSQPNLSMSRNVGICMARGDLVAFVDDDAIPEPEWLIQLANAYDVEEVGAVGGTVFDHTGYTFQYQYSTANRLGNANWSAGGPAEHLCFPGSYEFPYLQGTNTSFRRDALLKIGGFDEEIEYYLDETDVCCRLIDAGYVVRQLPNAYVHHKFAPSGLRDTSRIVRHRYPVLKNKIYFSLKHARRYLPIQAIVADALSFIDYHRRDVDCHIQANRLDANERERFEEQASKAMEVGLAAGLEGDSRLITHEALVTHQGVFGRFEAITPREQPKAIVLVSRHLPPSAFGGIATFTVDLARSLAARGHLVHVIAQSPDINRVDVEDGVWVHRLLPTAVEPHKEVRAIGMPEDLWNWSATALSEARRIATHRMIDVIEAPIWDCEGIAFLLDRSWPLVTSLHTPLEFWLRSNPEWLAKRDWMLSYGGPMLASERKVMTESHGIRANSRAIVKDIEKAYGIRFRPQAVRVVPHGLGDSPVVPKTTRSDDRVEVLFVGRLERRKGIDVLLDAIPEVCGCLPAVRFRLIGDKTLLNDNGRTYEQQFWASPGSEQLRGRVLFDGKVGDLERDTAYANCDIFVGPSRYESFGLIFLEAMRYAKPVVGCRAGGMSEVIDDGVTGILVEPGDRASLVRALVELARQPELRRRLGDAGAAAFRERFTAERMAADSIGLYDSAIRNFASDGSRYPESSMATGYGTT